MPKDLRRFRISSEEEVLIKPLLGNRHRLILQMAKAGELKSQEVVMAAQSVLNSRQWGELVEASIAWHDRQALKPTEEEPHEKGRPSEKWRDPI